MTLHQFKPRPCFSFSGTNSLKQICYDDRYDGTRSDGFVQLYLGRDSNEENVFPTLVDQICLGKKPVSIFAERVLDRRLLQRLELQWLRRSVSRSGNEVKPYSMIGPKVAAISLRLRCK